MKKLKKEVLTFIALCILLVTCISVLPVCVNHTAEVACADTLS